ncbi:chaplin ChpF [Streptomyces sannanensis]|uniref:Chaplin ChpF n=1 Tax=Streptomyces sannanensis TaxID=285536 RepID=A0ABP6SMZ6_9ACTN
MKLKKAAVVLIAAGGLIAFGSGVASAQDDPYAVGITGPSSGILTGNNVLVPIGLDLNACGNSINVIGLLNPAWGSTCSNG